MQIAIIRPYTASIGSMRLRLSELQGGDLEAQKFRGAEFAAEGWEDIDGILHHQGLPYVPQVIRSELISRHHDDPLAGHFGIEQDTGAGRQEVLLANPPPRRRGLCERLRRVSGFQGRSPQALWRPTIASGPHTSVEGPLHGLRHGFAGIVEG